MKESELIKKMKNIENHLKKSNLIENCIKVSREYGKWETETLNSRTKLDYNFKDENLEIIYSDGWGQGGGGEVKVISNKSKTRVLYGDRYALDDKNNGFNPQIDGFCILEYHPGRWEIYLLNILEQKINPKKEKTFIDKNVSESILKRLKKDFEI